MSFSSEERKSAFGFIVALGFVSLFADMTYEGAHSVIGPLLKDLGATATEVGIIAGLGEMIAASLRYFSGKLADRTRAYWTITTLGYFLNLVVVPGLAFAGSWQAAALLVVAERTGKSLRGPARDVLLSEATEVVGHGKGFGLHAAMDYLDECDPRRSGEVNGLDIVRVDNGERETVWRYRHADERPEKDLVQRWGFHPTQTWSRPGYAA